MRIVNSITKFLKVILGESRSSSVIQFARTTLPTFGHNFRFATADETSDLRFLALGNLLLQHKGMRVRKWLHYIEIYDSLFQKIKSSGLDIIRFLEIGVADGGSLQVWKSYFGESALIIGIDIDPSCSELPEVGKHVRIGSQADPEFLHSVVLELGGLNLVLDDGSHVGQDQLETFLTLWPLLESGGLYIIEDLHASFWPEFNKSPAESFLNQSGALIESLYQSYTKLEETRLLNTVGSTIRSIQFFDSVIVIEKGPRREPLRVSFP